MKRENIRTQTFVITREKNYTIMKFNNYEQGK